MKKIFTLLAIGLLAAGHIKAQSEVLFKMNYAPNHVYTLSSKTDMNMELNVSGDSTMIQQMKSAGQTFPMLMHMQMEAKLDVKAGALSANEFPVNMHMSPFSGVMTMNGKETPMPTQGTMAPIYGRYTLDGKLHIDSIGGLKSTDTLLKGAMLKMINDLQGNIKFPAKPMKVGESFVQEMPMDIPGLGAGMKMVAKTTYKLTAIANKQAFFDIAMEMAMDMATAQMTIKASGSGDGKMVYDISSSFPSSILNNMNMIYSLDMPSQRNMKMNGKMKMSSDVKTTVAAN